MLLSDVVSAWRDTAATRSRTAKIERIALLLRSASPAEAALAASWLSGALPQQRIGIGPAAVRDARGRAAPTAEPMLQVREVDEQFSAIAGFSGAGSTGARVGALAALFGRATADEQEFLARLIWGELRQGAVEGVMLDAVARAAGVPVALVRRAAQRAGDVPSVALEALTGGAAALAAFGMELFRPVQPMLAQPAENMADALHRLQTAALDYKLDGARVQVHRSGDEVRVYSRRLNDVTPAVPELVEFARSLPADQLVLDGEAIALRRDGRPLPFQVTMGRFGSRVDVDRLRGEVPLSVFCFDLLHVDGESLLDEPARQRFERLADIVGSDAIVPRIVTSHAAEAAAFMAAARAAGHEGVVAKALDAPYEAGSRGGAWLKVKQADTLDLVVIAAEWGNGRRQGWLSNLHLAARAADGTFVMLGKTFKGMTDTLLEWQTRELLARETGRTGHVVQVRPELVVEIAFEGVQASSRYPAGVALRFARVRGYRHDKTPEQADSIERVLALHRAGVT